MLFIKNYDKPGIIGFIGMVLGDFGVNIAEMKVTRAKRGDKALTIVTLDSELTDEVIDKISSNPGIIEVRNIKI